MSKQKQDKTSEIHIAKKRGRKSKKELELKDNIIISMEDTNTNMDTSINDFMEAIENDTEVNANIEENLTQDDVLLDINTNAPEEVVKQNGKKRGRKPKGGKIIQQIIPLNNIKEEKSNVILHLKCSLKDLNINTLLNTSVESFNFISNKNDNSYEFVSNENIFTANADTTENLHTNHIVKYIEDEIEYEDNTNKHKENDTKDLWKKLKILEHKLHINNIGDKKSACFWCTYDFDNPPVYIPKYHIKDSYHVYGCFCSPECATAYLMEENIDSSAKFERYHLINHIYTKIYEYEKNIKPAPNPYYMLEKYYGNLNIQEYRSLLKNERLFLIVDKPLTRILPELHEDNDDFIINNKIIPTNTFQLKKKLQKKHLTKKNILNEKFGLCQQ